MNIDSNGFKLRKYSSPAEYAEIYSYNFKVINSIDNNLDFLEIINYLNKFTGIDKPIILIDLKRFMIKNHEYYPYNLKASITNILLPIYLILISIKRYKDKINDSVADILLDNWSAQTIEMFYGDNVVNYLRKYKTEIISFNDLSPDTTLIFKHLVSLFLLNRRAKKIKKKYKLDLRRYLYFFFFDYLAGLTILKRSKPKLLISGNDNTCSRIKAKAANLDIMLIQNGKRPKVSDSAFCYADIYFSLEGPTVTDFRKDNGCVFNEIYYTGSLRLFNYMNNTRKDKFPHNIEFDLLYIPEFDSLFDIPNEKYSVIKSTVKKDIKLLNDIAIKADLRIAFHLRDPKLLAEIKLLNLFSSKISYFCRKDISVYKLVLKSEIIMAMASTVIVEAMDLQKKVIFLNLSENANINAFYSELDIEVTNNNSSCLLIIIYDLLGKPSPVYKGYINGLQDFISLLDKCLVKYNFNF